MKPYRSLTLLAAAAGLAAAGTAAAAQYATVISATPVVAQTGVPREECFEGQQVVRERPSGAGALIGAIVGGVTGNQIGHGFGRAAATGIGVVAGSAIGNSVEASHSGYATVPTRQCRVVTTAASRVVGYDVVYEYNGQRYSTRTQTDPGQYISVDVRPVAAPPVTYQPVPQARTVPHVRTTPQPETYVESLPATSYDGPTVAYTTAPPAYYRGSPYYDGYYGYGAPYYGGYYAPYPYYWGPAISIGFGHRWHGGGGYYHGHRR